MIPENANRPYQEIVEHLLAEMTRTGVINDTAPGAVGRTLIEAVSREFSLFYAQMNAVYESGFVDSATGKSLDHLVAILGIERIAGDTSVVELKITRDSRINARVVIPAGTQIAIEQVAGGRVIYEVADDYELLENEERLTLALHAQAADDQLPEDFSVSPVDSPSFVQPIAGIAGVEIAGPSRPIGISESDERLRARAKMAIAAAGGGTEKALEQELMAIPGVNGVRLRDASDPIEGARLSPGELEIILDADMVHLKSPPIQAQLEQAIARAKGPGILVKIRDTAKSILGGVLVVKPASATLADADARKLIGDVSDVIAQEIDGLEIGGTLVWNRLLAQLMAVENLADVNLASSSLTYNGSAIEMADITLGPSERLAMGHSAEALNVVLDTKPVVTLAVEVAMVIALPDPDVESQFRSELADAISRYTDMLNRGEADMDLGAEGLQHFLTGPDGVAIFADDLTTTGLTLRLYDTEEGSLVELTGSDEALVLPAATLFHVAADFISVKWAEDEGGEE